MQTQPTHSGWARCLLSGYLRSCFQPLQGAVAQISEESWGLPAASG